MLLAPFRYSPFRHDSHTPDAPLALDRPSQAKVKLIRLQAGVVTDAPHTTTRASVEQLLMRADFERLDDVGMLAIATGRQRNVLCNTARVVRTVLF
jgi:hypothetical protein